MPQTTVQLCTFTVGDLVFALEVTRIQEVILLTQITQVPLASKTIRGLVNLRGQIVTAVDMRARLSLPPRTVDVDSPPMNVVVRSDEGLMSLVVDAIGDVVTVEESTFEKPPSTLEPVLREVVDKVCKQPGQLILVLKPEQSSPAAANAA